MLPLIFMGFAGAAGLYLVADMFGIFSDVGSTANADIEDSDLEEKLPLLDEEALVSLEQTLRSDPLLSGDVPTESSFTLAEYDIENGTANATELNDLIVIPEEFDGMQDMIDALEGDDVVLGNSGETPIFGGEGNDTILAGDGFDQIFGDAGDDVLAGQGGADLIVGGSGGDLIYGGDGDDNIYDNEGTATLEGESDTDVMIGGAGDDGIVIEDGINLVSLGEGNDHVTIYSQSGQSAAAVITDFDPAEDALLIGIYAPNTPLPDGATTLPLSIRLSEIETPLGMATLVEPAVESQDLANQLEGANVSYAVLLGITPADLEGADIRLYATGQSNDILAMDSINNIAKSMGATRI